METNNPEERHLKTSGGSVKQAWLNRTVLGAGITSCLGDFCYETTTVLLPGYLAVLGVPAAALGGIEGAADALAAFIKMISGYIADMLGHRKALVVLGYALVPAGQVFIALAHGWPLILAGRLVSWFGKGIRGPLRNAIMAQAVSSETRGRAFGLHRGMDSLGAVCGPLLGVLLLGWAQKHPVWQPGYDKDGPDTPFRFVLWLSVIPGVLSALAFLLLVKDPEHSPNPEIKLLSVIRNLPTKFKCYLGAVGVFGLGDYSHSMLILAATQLLTPLMGVTAAARTAGLLYVWRNVFELVCAYPVGALADAVGHMPVLVTGCTLGALSALLMAITFWVNAHILAMLFVIFSVAGLYIAIQGSLESTVAAEMVHKDSLTFSYGLMGLVNGFTCFASSTLVGFLWTAVSPQISFAVASALMTIGSLGLTLVSTMQMGSVLAKAGYRAI